MIPDVSQVRDLHDKYCKQESRISKLEASDQFQNKQLEKLIKKMDEVLQFKQGSWLFRKNRLMMRINYLLYVVECS